MGYRFFSDCSMHYGNAKIPLYSYGTLFHHNKDPVFSTNDPPHTVKNANNALRACSRLPRCCGLRVVVACLLAKGIPACSYMGHARQSDVEVAWLGNALLLQRGAWDHYGMLLFQVQIAPVCGQWTASNMFQPEELYLNSMTGYYLLC